jgi:hypothetical protein
VENFSGNLGKVVGEIAKIAILTHDAWREIELKVGSHASIQTIA